MNRGGSRWRQKERVKVVVGGFNEGSGVVNDLVLGFVDGHGGLK